MESGAETEYEERMKPLRLSVVVAALTAPALLAGLAGGCGNDKPKDEPPPAPAPTPTPTPTPIPVATMVPEQDAGPDVADAADGDASDAKVVTGPTALQRCCAAIKQNAKSAPPEQQLIYGAAIAACNSGQLAQIPAQFRGGCQ